MKNKKRIVLLLSLFVLASCDTQISIVTKNSSNHNTTNSSNNFSNDSSTSISSNGTSSTTSKNESNNNSNSYTLSNGSSSNSPIQIIDNIPSNSCNTLILNEGNSSYISTQYSTGNYGFADFEGYNFQYYKTKVSSLGFTCLMPALANTIEQLNGSIANYSAIKDIDYMTIEYKSNADGKVHFGATKDYTCEAILTKSTSKTSVNLDLTNVDANYFLLESGTSNFDIASISIYYTNSNRLESTEFLSSGENLYRINPVRFEGNLISGKSSVEVPISINVTGSTYTVKSYKTYTYYSYDDAISTAEKASLASMTNPVDVANYFVAFGTYPANYVFKDNYSEANIYFGGDTRCVSVYQRTDGYVQAVPYATGSSGTPTYYECDIALNNSYSDSSRGVGRVVVFVDGFSQSKGATNYDKSPVAVYTDDHYTTFMEYYNQGSFSNRFNAIYGAYPSERVIYNYGAPTTLTK